jgi:hypothetical protein
MTTQAFKDSEREDLPSASSAQRRYACLGSPDTGSSPGNALADEGTLIHRALETGDYGDLNDDQMTIAFRIWDLMDAAFARWQEKIPEKNRVNVQKFSEERFWIIHPESKAKMESAKLDVCYVCGDRAIIIDAKSGFTDAIPSPRNAQLRSQALALWNHFPRLKEITVAIAQVRFKTNYNECVYTKPDLLMAQQQFLLVQWMRNQPDAPRNAGYHCQYCPIKDDCQTAATYSLVAQNSLALPSGDKEAVLAKVQALSHEQLAFVHSRSSIADKVFEAVKERLKSISEEERNAVGLTMGKPAKVAEVKDVDAAREILVTNNQLLTQEEFDEHVSLTLGKVEKIAVPRLAKREGINQKIAKERLRESLKDCIEHAEKSASLVPFVPESKQIQE